MLSLSKGFASKLGPKVRGSSDSAKGRAHAREGRRDCRLQGLCTGISHRPGLYASVGVQHSRSKLLSSFTQLPSTTPCCSLPPSGLKWRVCACVLRYPTNQVRTQGVKCRDFLFSAENGRACTTSPDQAHVRHAGARRCRRGGGQQDAVDSTPAHRGLHSRDQPCFGVCLAATTRVGRRSARAQPTRRWMQSRSSAR